MQSLFTLAQIEPVAWFFGLGILWVVLALFLFGFWVWALVHAIRNPALDQTMRLIWVIVLIFTQIVGAIIYAIVVARERRPTYHGGHHA